MTISIVFYSIAIGLIWAALWAYSFKDRSQWSTFLELYRLHHNTNRFFGTAIAGVIAVCDYLFKDGRAFYVGGVIKNGYALVFLSPLVLIYWAIISIFYIAPMTIGIPALILTGLWALLFELPADALNMNGNHKEVKRKVPEEEPVVIGKKVKRIRVKAND